MDEEKNDIQHDDKFTISYSESMDIRNVLRSKLVQAQGRRTDHIPMFVSWPGWLEDGIVCLYVNDLKEILRNAVRDTAHALLGTLDGTEEKELDAPEPAHPEGDAGVPGAFTPMSPTNMAGDKNGQPPAGSAGGTSAAMQQPSDTGLHEHQPARKSQRASSAQPSAPQAKPRKKPEPHSIGSMLGQDDIEKLIQEEMDKKKH